MNWSSLGDQINRDLNNGGRWFVTLFNEFEFPNNQGDYSSVLTSGSLSPWNPGGITQNQDGEYSDALAYKGVYEIAGTYDNYSSNLTLMTYTNFPTLSSTVSIGGGVPGNSLGMLIWKAKAVGKGTFVLVQDNVTGGVGAGAFTSKYAPKDITENFEQITKTFGSNTS